jgi:hypothetical protein
LRALAGGGEGWGGRARSTRIPRLFDSLAQLGHGALDEGQFLFGRELVEVSLRGELDVGTQAIRVQTRLLKQARRGAGDGFQMDVAVVLVNVAQAPRDLDELLHRVVRRLNHAAAEEQAFDVVALVELDREIDDLVDRKARPRRVARHAVHAVLAVVDAVVRQQDLQQRHAPPVGRVAVTDADLRRVAQRPRAARALRAAGGARRVVLRGVSEDGEFNTDVRHARMLHRTFAVRTSKGLQSRIR